MHMQKNGQPSVALRHKIQAWMARWPLHSIHITNWILHRKKSFFLSANLVWVIFNVVTTLYSCVGQMNFDFQILKNKNRYVDTFSL